MLQDPLSKNWVVLTQAHAWDKDRAREDYIYYNPSAKKELVFAPEANIDKKSLQKISEYMFIFNDLNVCAGIWGWMASIFIKQRLYETKAIRFPVLMIHGQAGSGKSETARHIIQPFFGDISPMLRVDDITSFAFTALGSSTTMFPLVYDEYKPALFDNGKIKLISKMIRGLYDNESSMRGQKDLTTKEFKVFAPATIIGEMGFEEPALRERSIDIFVSKATASKHLEMFIELSKTELTKFGNAFLNWTLTISDEKLFEVFKSNIKGNGRVKHNIAMVNTGLDLLNAFFKINKVSIDGFDELKKVVYNAQMDSQTISGDTRSAVDNIVEGIMVMYQSDLIPDDRISINQITAEVSLHTPTIYPTFKKWARDTSFEGEVISHSEFVRQLSRMAYYKDYKAVRMDDVTRKARILCLNQLKDKEIADL